MRKKLLTVAGLLLLLTLVTAVVAMADGGFDQYGYNYTANNFVGTGMSWCQKLGVNDPTTCNAILGGPYSNDKLVMKWSRGWDDARFHGAPWGPDAWLDNEWNGQFPSGSGFSEHYKIVWVGPLLQDSPYWRPGGYPVWGEFEVMMDQGVDPTHSHFWYARSIPNGYGLWP